MNEIDFIDLVKSTTKGSTHTLLRLKTRLFQIQSNHNHTFRNEPQNVVPTTIVFTTLQFQSIMEKLQRKKICQYKKTMEVSEETSPVI